MESKLAELVSRLQTATGENLQSVVLFGSAVAGEFSAEHSNLNILCLLERASASDLLRLRPAVAWWTEQGNPAPMIFTLEELRRSAHLFAIELFDIKNHHRILFGPDWLENFQVPLRLHRLLVESELHSYAITLRQEILAAPEKLQSRFDVMRSSVSRFCALFRHAAMAAGEPQPQSKRESVAAMAAWTGADPSGFEAVLDYREGKRKLRQIDLEAALHSYLEFVTLAAGEATRRFSRQH